MQSTQSAESVKCASTEKVDLTPAKLKQRIETAQKIVAVGEREVRYSSPGHKVSTQAFKLLDQHGKWFAVTTQCTGDCFANPGEGCGVSGCDAHEGNCTDIECTDGVCSSRCTKISTQ